MEEGEAAISIFISFILGSENVIALIMMMAFLASFVALDFALLF